MLEPSLQENETSRVVVDKALKVHTKLGPGLLEKVYEEYLFHLLRKDGWKVEKQKDLPVVVDDLRIEAGFRVDLIVNDCLIVEIKAVENLHPVHAAQMHTYLKLADKNLGLLLNFNVPSMKDGIKRIVRSR